MINYLLLIERETMDGLLTRSQASSQSLQQFTAVHTVQCITNSIGTHPALNTHKKRVNRDS